MPTGYHQFYGYWVSYANARDRAEDYFIGGLVGDYSNDEAFAARLKRVEALLTRKLKNLTTVWSPVKSKPYKPRTTQQRLDTALKKSRNKYLNSIAQIKTENSLFVDWLTGEENQKFRQREQTLLKRYKPG